MSRPDRVTITLLGVQRTIPEQRRGLMGLESIPENSGMLFVYPFSRQMSFWMKDTLIPLQIAFITPSHEICCIKRMRPRSLAPVWCEIPCTMALEVEDGTFDRLGITVGSRVELDPAETALYVTLPRTAKPAEGSPR